MDRAFEAQLRVDGVTVTADDVALLRAVDEHGSLNAASDALGRSYSRAHGRLETLEDALGTLVERRRGGPEGGGSDLSDRARELLARFARLEATLARTAGSELTVLRGTVADRTGDLVSVETSVGAVRALSPTDETEVQVAIPADAVTLQDPESAPAERATSARNRFEGTVSAVDRRDGVASVAVDLGSATLAVLLTADSVDRLALEPGQRVVASFKATAVRATRVN